MLIGVEIDATSIPLTDDYFVQRPFFDKDTALVMGNEGQGIHPNHKKDCTGGFVRIPQYGSGTASLNVNVAASVVLHRYYTELQRLRKQQRQQQQQQSEQNNEK